MHQKPFVNSHVLVRGFDSGGEFCKDFDLDSSQVKKFFDKAKVKTSREIHDEFDYLPCYVQGSSITEGQTVHWEIRAGGTARVTYPDGLYNEFGCTDCF